MGHKKIRIALTMGDPGGVGPRILVRALANARFSGKFIPLIFGHSEILQEAARIEGIDFHCRSCQTMAEARHLLSYFPDNSAPIVVEAGIACSGKFSRGKVAAENGHASLSWITAAVESCLSGDTTALVTAPISKEAIRAAGAAFPGHTELLASLSGASEVRMMLVGGGLRVVLETIHVPLVRVPSLLRTERLIETLRVTHAWSQKYFQGKSRIAVCGLNPHAGENGQFGREEIDIIAPAIQLARQGGIDVSGPYPADTVFHRARQGEFDFVVAMYHDQGLGPLKTVAFDTGVNVTLGLPFVRTSPDHGTAFDRAWDPTKPVSSRSMEKAVELALSCARKNQQEASAKEKK